MVTPLVLLSRLRNSSFFLILNLFLAALGLHCRARRLSLVVASGGYFLLRCVVLLRWLLLLWSTGSRHTGFSSRGTRAQ